jgi:hypothetical protein
MRQFRLGLVLCLVAACAQATPAAQPAVTWPALCASYYASVTDPGLNVEQFGAWLAKVKVTCTRAWLLDAWAIGEKGSDGVFLRGQYDGAIPVRRAADGRFDLSAWNDAYFARLRRYVEVLNTHGVWPHLTFLDLYTWSEDKASLPFVPDADKGPFRYNVNGVRWGAPDAATIAAMPDAWMKSFMCRVVATLRGTSWAAELGNEMPDRGLHTRMAAALRACGWTGDVTVNRDATAPGQYWNMDVGRTFSRIAFHGFPDMSYLDTPYPEEATVGRPTTFRQMWGKVDPARVIVSSDGGGGDPKHLPELKAVACDTLKRGATYEHQLGLKRRRFFGDGTLRMADLAIDEAFLLSLSACRR